MSQVAALQTTLSQIQDQIVALTTRTEPLTATDLSGVSDIIAESRKTLTADAVKARMEQLKVYFPPGMEYKVPYDSSKFVRISIKQVVETLAEAVALVFVVMLIFLQIMAPAMVGMGLYEQWARRAVPPPQT
jgi:hypothetical protein